MRFLLIDDHPIFREAVANRLRTRFSECGVLEFGSIAAACDAAYGLEIDLILTELAMSGVTGFEGLLGIRERLPKARVAILSGLDDPNMIRAALRFGAAGFVSKRAERLTFDAAVDAMLTGAVYVPSALRRRSSRPLTTALTREAEVAERIRTLTSAQLKVLTCIKNGMVNKQIAYELNVGLSTVKAHVSAIIQKLGVATRTQIVIETQTINFVEVAAAKSTNEPDRKLLSWGLTLQPDGTRHPRLLKQKERYAWSEPLPR
ncbi:response regulator transcription factor [Chenggangzhangella methanolivorans]|uniref:Response regulator transcription factor n=1 Tax=Chenggangzhangella methanolivorans TaxID=1437009 RepID=A0A9E6RC78_9HYPH|nr:response regulator transcription factor [Chenggangzhangella methanolivorans]QZO02153.1 response regulator transcription factor [Chenggangzhangella methanolivorans]